MTPNNCPHCGAGPDTDMPERYWACGSGNLHPHPRQMSCYEREAEQLRARVLELEAVVGNPEALWTNYLRGVIRMPSGIGDVRALNARVRELEERIERLVEAGGLAVQHCAPNWLDSEARAACKARAVEALAATKEAKP